MGPGVGKVHLLLMPIPAVSCPGPHGVSDGRAMGSSGPGRVAVGVEGLGWCQLVPAGATRLSVRCRTWGRDSSALCVWGGSARLRAAGMRGVQPAQGRKSVHGGPRLPSSLRSPRPPRSSLRAPLCCPGPGALDTGHLLCAGEEPPATPLGGSDGAPKGLWVLLGLLRGGVGMAGRSWSWPGVHQTRSASGLSARAPGLSEGPPGEGWDPFRI